MNSRFAGNGELPDKRLVGLPIIGGKTVVLQTNCEIPVFTGIAGNVGRSRTDAERSKERECFDGKRRRSQGTGSRARAVRGNDGVT